MYAITANPKDTPLQAIDVAHNGHAHRNGARLWRALVDAFESRTVAQVFIKDRELQALKHDTMPLHDFYLQWKMKLREWIAAGGRPSNINLLTCWRVQVEARWRRGTQHHLLVL